MKVLLVGGGAREHALAWKLLRDDPSLTLIAAPGNPGISELARCVSIQATDLDGLLALAEKEKPELTVVGPEAPLATGIVDRFRSAGPPIFGPTAAAARIESSKAFAKELMVRAGVPTARAERHTDPSQARAAARRLGAPVVIKASGLAAGKGVIVASTLAEADDAIDSMLVAHTFGDAASEILVEEFMTGEELSIFAITDGTNVLPMIPVQDHKRLLEGDEGPNTGGMGAYAPVSIVTDTLWPVVRDSIFLPTLRALRNDGTPFTGLLYAGLMLTPDGPKVVEFNCRFGDPETEAILPLMTESLLQPMLRVARGERLAASAGSSPGWDPSRFAVTTVVSAPGYPDAPTKGAVIQLPAPRADVHIFHAGTARRPDGALVTAGGRVLAITALADSFADAQRISAEVAGEVDFSGRHFRSDIGWRELKRHARAARN
jgi:phosphoribosylamine--glycine ligase